MAAGWRADSAVALWPASVERFNQAPDAHDQLDALHRVSILGGRNIVCITTQYFSVFSCKTSSCSGVACGASRLNCTRMASKPTGTSFQIPRRHRHIACKFQGLSRLRRSTAYSGSTFVPFTWNVPATAGASVFGWPPPTDTEYRPWAMIGSPAALTMLKSRSFSSKRTFCDSPGLR